MKRDFAVDRFAIAECRNEFCAIEIGQGRVAEVHKGRLLGHHLHAFQISRSIDIDLEFNAPGAEQDLRLGVNVRRNMLLIFKEAVSNAARHSNSTSVVIDFSADNHRLSLRVADNGIGFDPISESAGHGLVSMRRRAQKLDGNFEIDSSAGRGTTVRVEIPRGAHGRVP